MTEFHKMHGLGNDFIIIDERHVEHTTPVDTSAIIALSNRKTGIGCDQFLILRRSNEADVFMIIFNADGSRVSACGNATRCVASLLNEIGSHLVIQTDAGLLECDIFGDQIAVNMGVPRCNAPDIPLSDDIDTLHVKHGIAHLPSGVCVNMGNPHLVIFVNDLSQTACDVHGAILETHSLFPQKANINFAQILNKQTIALRTYERGVGLTQACGTGACATAVAARRRELTLQDMHIHMPGGILDISWAGNKQHMNEPVIMKGGAHYVFSGTLPQGVWR